jgi:hypothetical protein
VLLRGFLALPLTVVLVFIAIATIAVVIVGWFGALFMARTPKFTRDLVTTFLRLNLRLQTYVSLMTDRFPAFSFDETPADMSRLAVPIATRMSRVAVFFRIILVIPASLLTSVVTLGMEIIGVFMWFVVLITGWLPASVHQAYSASIRYSTRYAAYFYLLVPTYPGGLFGDQPSVTGTVFQSASTSPIDGPTATDIELTAIPEPALPIPTTARPWDVVLDRGGKTVLIIALVIGTPAFIGLNVANLLGSSAFQHQRLVNANNTLVGDINQFTANGKACQMRSDEVACLERNDHIIAEQLTNFADTLNDNSDARISHSVQDNAIHNAQSLAGLFYLAASAGPTKADYQHTANAVKLDEAAVQMETSLSALQHALNNS